MDLVPAGFVRPVGDETGTGREARGDLVELCARELYRVPGLRGRVTIQPDGMEDTTRVEGQETSVRRPVGQIHERAERVPVHQFFSARSVGRDAVQTTVVIAEGKERDLAAVL